MAINIFKKEKKSAKREAVKKRGEVSVKRDWNILKSPSITEKAAAMADQGNFYVFEVDAEADKPGIKAEIENKYKVNVLQVRTINVHRKKIRRGKTEGFKKGSKKAIVKLKEGESIEIAAK